jgi:microcystin-dependent protein
LKKENIMSEPFLGQISIASFGFAPRGWALCNGQLLPINQNQALFALLGTTYGGDGRTNFALPNLQGRVPVHAGAGFMLGQSAGGEAVTVSVAQLPAHGHLMGSANQATATTPVGNVLASRPRLGVLAYTQSANLVPLSGESAVGGSQSHENRQPFLILNFIIALQGIFPSQN